MRNLIVGFLVVVLIVATVLVIKGRAKVGSLVVPTPVSTPTVQQKLQNKFQNLVIPNGGEQIELRDVGGTGGMGIATRSEIIADLPGLASGQTYQAYLADSTGKTVLIGTLKMQKGGWILDYNSSNHIGYNKVIIVQGITHVLEGSF